MIVKTLGREADETERLAVKARALQRRAGRRPVSSVRGSSRRSRRCRRSARVASCWPSDRGASSSGAVTLGDLVAVHRAVRPAGVADAVHRMDPVRAAASRGQLRPPGADLRASPSPSSPPRTPCGCRTDPLDARLSAVTYAYAGDARPRRGQPADRRRTNRWRSSARPASARARWRSCWSGWTTPTTARCWSAASTSAMPTAALRRTRPRSCSRRASCSPPRCATTSAWTPGPRPEDDRARGADRAGRRVHPPASRRLRHRGGRTRPHAVRRAAPARGAGAGAVRRPRLLILDDATSAVDPTIEAQILAALRRELRTTLVVVAYRLSTIRLADRVLYLEDGRLRATGSHDELLASHARLRRHDPRVRTDGVDEPVSATHRRRGPRGPAAPAERAGGAPTRPAGVSPSSARGSG